MGVLYNFWMTVSSNSVFNPNRKLSSYEYQLAKLEINSLEQCLADGLRSGALLGGEASCPFSENLLTFIYQTNVERNHRVEIGGVVYKYTAASASSDSSKSIVVLEADADLMKEVYNTALERRVKHIDHAINNLSIDSFKDDVFSVSAGVAIQGDRMNA
jgi:hypothetical protein